jgi:hypothetical protein
LLARLAVRLGRVGLPGLRATGSLQLHHSRWQVMANVDAQAVGGEQFAVIGS